ncbi:hypothetical protein AZE42_09895, partial [Rhizopogon vesiculosus]
EQIAGWKEVTDTVHEKKSFIFCQLWALRRAAFPRVLAKENNSPLVSASPISLSTRPTSVPHALTEPEIKTYIANYAAAARKAIEAGFDGVEIHSANGYLIDQFLQEVSNTREDEWGGCIEKRARFAIEIVHAIVQEVGAERVGIRLSPCCRTTLWCGEDKDRVFISAGGYTRQTAIETAEEKGGTVAFGRLYIPNVATYDRATFYIPGDYTGKGYTDFPAVDDVPTDTVPAAKL